MDPGAEFGGTLGAMILLLGVGGLVASCVITWFASGRDRRVSPFWGVAGPVGWIVAALRGVQERQRRARRATDDLNAMLMRRLGSGAPPSIPPPSAEPASPQPGTGDRPKRSSRPKARTRAAEHDVPLVRASHATLTILSHDWRGLPAVVRFRTAVEAAARDWNAETRVELREAAETVAFALGSPGSPYEASTRLAALQRALAEPDPEIV